MTTLARSPLPKNNYVADKQILPSKQIHEVLRNIRQFYPNNL